MDRPLSSHYSSHSNSLYNDPLKPVSSFAGELPPPHFTLGSNVQDTRSSMIHAFNFDMWVSTPQHTSRIDKALHVYTRLQGDQHQPAAPMPLESIADWRTSFPHLASVVDDVNDPLDCDIILLEANLELMNDFPPSGSRLGIQLELDYAHPMAGDVSMVSQMEDWTCGTRIYEGGQEMLETYNDLQKTSSARVKPLFESPWWAKLFTQLTQEKRMAEDSGHYHAADEHTRQFFRSLSAVQELRASPQGARRLSHPYPVHSGEQTKRMAILLWKFRQTRPGEVGTTTWRRIIPPPERTTASSPRPAIDMPPMSLDSILLTKPPSQSIYQTHQPQELLPASTSQPQWPMYPAQDNVGNMYNPNGTFDFLNPMTKEDGFGDKTSVTAVMDTFPSLQTETTHPGGPVMLNVNDLNSLSHPNLASYNSMNHNNHYMPPQQQSVGIHDNNNNVLNSIFGTSTQSIDDIGHSQGSWTGPPTTLPEVGEGYNTLQFNPGEHPVSASRETQQSNSLEGLIPPDDLMDKIVGGMPSNMNGAGPQHVNSAYANGDATETE